MTMGHAWRAAAVAIFASALFGCGGSATDEETSSTEGSELAAGGAPLACADPTVFSTKSANGTWFVFCTGMTHVWTTTDWKTFSDARKDLTFDFGDMPARSKEVGRWWAPTVTYDGTRDRYVMWVSVIDGQPFPDDTRSLAVFHAGSPLGPWRYAGYGDDVTKNGEMAIDPMIFKDHDGAHYLYWKRYGGGLTSRIMGARLTGDVTRIVGSTRTEIMDGYDGNGWELNVRENPAVWRNPSSGHYHMLFSGAHWADDTYATGHAISTCGPLCKHPSGGWSVSTTGHGGVPQVVQAKSDPKFAFGGPGGAVWVGNGGDTIAYAAASRSASGDKTRYLHKDPVVWSGGSVPYVNRPHHHPVGF